MKSKTFKYIIAVCFIILIALSVIGFKGCIKNTGMKNQASPSDEVVVVTDKTEYIQGDMVKISVKNSLDKSVWYLDLDCYPWWKLERKRNETWELLRILPPILTKYGEHCISACPPPQEPIEELIKELKPGSEISDNWNLKNCEIIEGKLNIKFIEPGTYRFFFSYGLSKDSWNEKKSYSNEFIIKQ